MDNKLKKLNKEQLLNIIGKMNKNELIEVINNKIINPLVIDEINKYIVQNNSRSFFYNGLVSRGHNIYELIWCS